MRAPTSPGVTKAGDRRFTFVHLLLDTVPMARRSDLVRHALYALVEPGGRVLVSHYKSAASADLSAAGHLARLGFAVGGESSTSDGAATLAWIDVSPLP